MAGNIGIEGTAGRLAALALAAAILAVVPSALRAEEGMQPLEALIEARLDALAAQRAPLPADAVTRIELSPGAPLDAASLGRFEHDPASGRFSGTAIGVEGEARPIHGRAAVVVPAMMPVRRIAAGEIVAGADLAETMIPVSVVTPHVLRDTADIAGKEARRPLMPDRPVQAQSLIEPRAIRRGEGVDIVLRSGGLSLLAPGRALADAAEGDSLRVVNTSSNKTITVVATGPGQVSVVAPSAEAATPKRD